MSNNNEDKSFSKIINDHKERHKEISIKRELRKELLFLSRIMITIFGSVIALIFIFKEEIKDIFPESKIFPLIIFFGVVLFFIFLFCYLTKKISESLSKNSLDFLSEIETAEQKYEELDRRMNDYLESNKKISENIKNAPISYLLSWEESINCEKEADSIHGITYDLAWVKDQVDNIFNNLKSNPTKIYKYIVLQKSASNLYEIERKVREVISQDPSMKQEIKDRFKIKCYNPRNGFSLPLPNDIALYEIKGKKFLVMSPRPVEETIRNSKDESYTYTSYDVRFIDQIHVYRVEKWFTNVWDESKEIELADIKFT
ncbi:MAG: hypothetical protein LBL79_03205 [Prevotella sp.]|jgi:hypothetical protein|nr:hypothetical protein [Prevotella sp.]